MPRRARRALVLALTLALAAGACTGDDNADPVSTTTSGGTDEGNSTTTTPAVAEIEWEPCGGDDDECGTLEVPLDWEDPDGEQIELAVFRHPAEDPDERIGVLVVNPGGPGFPATEFAPVGQSFLPQEVVDRFDIIGFDSRGTGGTIPVDCVDDLEDVYALDPTPDTESDVAERDDVGDAVAESCEEESGDVLSFVSTERTARDLDLLRAALGEDQLNLLGYSYGTYLGGMYADLFPDRVRAFVLDGAVDPTLTALEQFIQQAGGGEVALDAFFEDCAAGDECPFNDDPGTNDAADLADRFDDLMASIDEVSLPAGDGNELGPGEAHLGVFGSLFTEGDWPALADALAAASDGDGKPLWDAYSDYVSRLGEGEYANISEAYWAISMADGVLPTSLAEFDEIVDEHPRLGPAIVAENLMGAYWPDVAAREPAPFVARGSNPILVIGNTRDPATPYEAAVALADQLDNGVLLTYDGDGHTIYADGVECIDDVVDAYLIELEVPEAGTEC